MFLLCFYWYSRLFPDESVPDTSLDRGGDGQSSDEDFVLTEKQSGNKENVEWDSYTSGKILFGSLP